MRVARHESSEQFLVRTREFLESMEVRNGLLLGIAYSLLEHPAPQEGANYLATIEDGDRVCGAAIYCPPRKLVVSDLPPEGISPLAAAVFASGVAATGVHGPEKSADAFARAYADAAAVRAEAGLEFFLYECVELRPIEFAPGKLRAACAADRSRICDWYRAFVRETGIDGRREDAEALVDRRIAEESLFLWEAAEVVAMAGFTPRARNGAHLNMVYTPPALRGRGYARSSVATLAERLFAAGREYCSLYADRRNDAANCLYEKIGFVRIGEFAEWSFSEQKREVSLRGLNEPKE